MEELARSLAGMAGVSVDVLAFWLGGVALVLSLITFVQQVVLRGQDRALAEEMSSIEETKELQKRKTELSDNINEQLGMVIQNLKKILESESLDQCEEYLRWVMSKQIAISKMAIVVQRTLGKSMGKRFKEILDKLEILKRYNEKENTYEVFLQSREQSDLMIKRLIIKIEAFLQAMVKELEKV